MFTRDSIQHHKESGKDACLMCMDFSWELTTKLLSEDTLEFQVPDLWETHLAENQHLHKWLWYIMIIPSRARCLPGFCIGWIRGKPRIIRLGISWHPTFPEDFCYQPPVGTTRPARKGGRGELCNQGGGVRGLLGLGRGGSQQPPSGEHWDWTGHGWLGNPWTEWRLIVGNIIYKLWHATICHGLSKHGVLTKSGLIWSLGKLHWLHWPTIDDCECKGKQPKEVTW